MATTNPFDLLGDDDTEDPSQLIAAQQKVAPAAEPKKPPAPAAQPAKLAKLPSKPLPPSRAVKESRETKNEGGHGSGFGGGRGSGRGRGGGRGFNRDSANNHKSFGNGFSGRYRQLEDGDTDKPNERCGGYGGPRGSFHGGRRGRSNDEAVDGEHPKRYEHHSGTGRGNELKREGSGRGNWRIPSDEIVSVALEPVVENEKNGGANKQVVEEEAADGNKEKPVNEREEKEPEEKEMTLEEYEMILEEKRKALLSLKTSEERKVNDKEFQSMHQLSSKKGNYEIFIKLVWSNQYRGAMLIYLIQFNLFFNPQGSDKDKRKDAEKDEKSKKSAVKKDFLKSGEAKSFFAPGGRGERGHGRGDRGDRDSRGDRGARVGRGFSGTHASYRVPAPSIEDPGQFPTLGGK